MVPVGLTAAGGALVACTAAVGTAVGAAFAGAEVAAGAAFAGAEVAAGADLACGTAVAEDPQANNNATNSNTMALGRCLGISDLIADCGTNLPLFVRITTNQ
jgi:hypothetical protein